MQISCSFKLMKIIL